jgi:hypothetical protein
MKRTDYDRLRHYRHAECCANCGNLLTERLVNATVRDAEGTTPIRLKCKELVNKRVDVTIVVSDYVCNAWRPE